jgi:hypothetical protein
LVAGPGRSVCHAGRLTLLKGQPPRVRFISLGYRNLALPARKPSGNGKG